MLNEEISVIEDKLEELFERIGNIEKQIKEYNEEQIKKLKAEIDYAKFCCTLTNVDAEKFKQED